MNASFNALHLVNTYGAFGSVTRERHEIVIEGTATTPTAETGWQEYEFRGKPGDPRRLPRQFAPYHLRLDWLMWFAALSPAYAEPWFTASGRRLLEGDRATLRLLRHNPFPDEPPVLRAGAAATATGSRPGRSGAETARGGIGAGRRVPAAGHQRRRALGLASEVGGRHLRAVARCPEHLRRARSTQCSTEPPVARLPRRPQREGVDHDAQPRGFHPRRGGDANHEARLAYRAQPRRTKKGRRFTRRNRRYTLAA